MTPPPKRPPTLAYWVFYILFWPDTWRILMGLAVALLLAPLTAPPDLALSGRVMLYVMLAVIGWAAGAIPAGWIVSWLKKIILGKSRL